MHTTRTTLLASCLAMLSTGSCTSSNPVTVDLGMMSVDLSMPEPPPADLATFPPDMTGNCGFGQTFSAGACACDAQHAILCTDNTWCCGITQTCLPTPGPRGEKRCSGPPLLREAAGLGYDLVHNNLILRTGHCLDAQLNDTLCTDQWVLGQQTWDPQTPATAITARYGSTMMWLTPKNLLVLFGGQTTYNNFSSQTNEMYSWDGTNWTKMAPTTPPPARAFTAMAYDASRQVTVMYGGNGVGDTDLGDTWEYNATTNAWRMLTPASDPGSRQGHGIIYDANLKKIVMHGGIVNGVYGRDTWIYDGNDWTKLADNAAIPLHAYFSMVYDPDRKVTVLYGGEDQNGMPLGETWVFSNGAWAKSTPAASPGVRTKPSMAYDKGRQQMVLFGGNSGTNLLKDAWAWDGTIWTKLY